METLSKPAPKLHYTGHRARLKKKYTQNGLDGWLDYEIVEFMLSYSYARKDTKPLAKELLKKFKTISGVVDADINELCQIKGIGAHSSVLLKLFKDISILYTKSAAYNKDLISSPQAAIDYLNTVLRSLPNEEFHALFLDSGNHLIATETLHDGTVNKSVVYPRKVVERALHYHAAGVIISHNHPGKTTKPSDDDYKATKSISEALSTVDIILLDHILICGSACFSWKEHNLL